MDGETGDAGRDSVGSGRGVSRGLNCCERWETYCRALRRIRDDRNILEAYLNS